MGFVFCPLAEDESAGLAVLSDVAIEGAADAAEAEVADDVLAAGDLFLAGALETFLAGAGAGVLRLVL